jgi:adenosylcobinamide-GDP ribazoletransferase
MTHERKPLPCESSLLRLLASQTEGQVRAAAVRALAEVGSLLTLPGVAACGWVSPLRTGIGVVAVAVASAVWAGYVRRRLGGVTGDCLGCGCYLGQCVFLLAVAAGAG